MTSLAAAPDLLATIVAATGRIVEVRSRECPPERLEAMVTRAPRGDLFAEALSTTRAPRIIAECKRRSPSRGILRLDYDPAAHATAYERAGAAAISVLTEPAFFDGDPDHLRQVRAAVSVPILRKDFIISEYQLLEAAALGADAVLLVAGALRQDELRRLGSRAAAMGLATLVEVRDLEELRRAIDMGARIVGVNSRNLRTLSVDHGVLEALAAYIPGDVIAVAESGIRTPQDLGRLWAHGYDAFLVGERLIAEPDPGAALRELRGA
jgi:indole-3-glycerol phosphate synthase